MLVASQAVVLRVGGAFPQLYLNGQPEEVEENGPRVGKTWDGKTTTLWLCQNSY